MNFKTANGLLSQSTVNQTIGQLILGHYYRIMEYNEGDDFTNCGAIHNEEFELFIATEDTPTLWNGSLLCDVSDSIPIATYFNNEIGEIEWIYANDGNYVAQSEGNFSENALLFITPKRNLINDEVVILDNYSFDINGLSMNFRNLNDSPTDLNNTKISFEIRVPILD